MSLPFPPLRAGTRTLLRGVPRSAAQCSASHVALHHNTHMHRWQLLLVVMEVIYSTSSPGVVCVACRTERESEFTLPRLIPERLGSLDLERHLFITFRRS